MSYPNFPHINPEITLTRDDAINLLLSAVAMEELSLTQILAAEGEKMKYALGTLPGAESSGMAVDELMTIDQSVKGTLDTAIRLEMLLQSRLETLLNVSERFAEERFEGKSTDPSVKPVITTEAEEEAEPAAIHEEANLQEEEEITATVEMDEPDVAMESFQTNVFPAEESESAYTDVEEIGWEHRTQLSQISAFGASTDGPDISIEDEGTNIALPHNQVLQGISVDDSNAVFTVSVAGHYVVTYSVHLTEALPISARLIMNESSFAPSVIGSDQEASTFYNTVILPLEPGDTLSLQLFDFNGEATLIAGAGATLTIVKLV